MTEERRKDGISRRKFLKDSTLSSAGVAALGGVTARHILGAPLASEANLATGPSLAPPPEIRPSATIHVSPDGNDSNDGSKERPFATLQKARDAARSIKKEAAGPTEIVLLAGTYYVGETLKLGPEDSGTQKSPIIYRAAEDGAATVSGGLRLKCNWAPYKDGIYVCDVPQAAAGGLNFAELYINGRRQTRARFPNGDSRIPQPAGYVRAAGADKWPHKELYYHPETFTPREWAHPEDAVVFAFQRASFTPHYFFSGQWHVQGIDRSRNAILLGEGGHQQMLFHYLRPFELGIYADVPFYIENVFEELDAPGEWFLDRREGKLYYMPAEGVDLKTAIVEPGLVQRVVLLQGTPANPVKHITLRGIHIAQAASTYFESYSPAGLGDYTLHRGGALTIDGAEDIRVEGCAFDGVSGNGCFVNNYARRIRITNCRLSDIGENGICFVGKKILREDKRFRDRCGFLNWWGWDPESTEIPMDCDATNNLIHDTGVFAKQSAAILIATSQRIGVVHNHIYNAPRSGINVNDSRYGGHRIEFNDVHDTVRETSDHGPLNYWGREPYYCHYVCHPDFLPKDWSQEHGDRNHSFGSFADVTKYAKETTIIRHNRFSASRLSGNPRPGDQFGIDLDDGAGNVEVCENLCVDLGVKVKEGTFLRIHDNFIISSEVKIICLANHDSHVVSENNTIFFSPSTIEDVARVQSKYMSHLRFGLTDEFPARLRDEDRTETG